MTTDEMFDEMKRCTPEFIGFCKEAIDLIVERTNKFVGFTDQGFVLVISEMWDEPTKLLNLSQEHRQAVLLLYQQCKSAWASAGGTDSEVLRVEGTVRGENPGKGTQ